jgi:hypothetical protein
MIAVKVLDNQTGEVLPNAHVFPLDNGIPAYNRGSSTSLDGIAEVHASPGEELKVTFVGYEDYIFEVTSGIVFDPNFEYQIQTIGLDPADNMLEEAVIFGSKSKRSFWPEIIAISFVVAMGILIWKSE